CAIDSLPGCGLAHCYLATSSFTRCRFASDGLPGCGLATCSLTRSCFAADGLPCCSLARSRFAGRGLTRCSLAAGCPTGSRFARSSWSAASCHKFLGYARPRCAPMDIAFLITRTGLHLPCSGVAAHGVCRGQRLACTALCTRPALLVEQ